MKQLISSLFLAIALPVALYAQQPISQGMITYDLKLQLRKQVAKKNPAIAALVPEVMHNTIEVPFRNEVFAVIMKPNKSSHGAAQIQSSGGNAKQIVDLKSKIVRIENVFNGRSYYSEQAETPKATISYQSGVKQIAGYSCNKATVVTTDKKRYTVWYTTAIPNAYSPEGLEFAAIKGAVLEYENDELTCTATSIKSDAFNAAAIAADPKAKKITPEQMQDLQEDAAANNKKNATVPGRNGQQQATQTVEIKL